MATSAAQPAGEPGKTSVLANLAPIADSLSKTVAAAAIAIYACGFLIVSIHHASFGFATDPFRPRILAAGAWFLLLAAVPCFTAFELRNYSWLTIVKSLYYVWSGLTLASLSVFRLIFTADPVSGGASWRGIPFLVISIGLLVALGMTKTPEKLKVTFAVVLILIALFWNVWELIRGFGFGALTLWFFALSLFFLIETKTRSRSASALTSASAMLLFVFAFAGYYYPHLRAAFGGGSPVPATIYFSKDSPIKAGQSIAAQVVEESDQGFYIVAPNQKKAVFVPRNTVSLVYFGEKPADSVLLH